MTYSSITSFKGTIRIALGVFVLIFAMAANAQTPAAANGGTSSALSDAETQGRALAQKILSQTPPNNFTNTGILRIKDANSNVSETSLRCQTIVTDKNWFNVYEVGLDNLVIVHTPFKPNEYSLHGESGKTVTLSKSEIMAPFAGSDFWIADLGLEFFYWPGQKVLKQESHRHRDCTVLESTNPNPTASGYSRVVAWIDNESFGIVEAYAYDVNGKKLKDFYPKDFKKVNGQWQVQTLVMENVQTGTSSRLEFELKK